MFYSGMIKCMSISPQVSRLKISLLRKVDESIFPQQLFFLGRSASLNISFFHFIVTLNIRNHLFTHFPPNIGLDKDVLKTFQRRLEDVFCLRLQDVLVKANTFALVIRLQKKSSRLLGQDQYIRLDHTSSRRLQNVFKTSSRRLAKTFSRRLQDVLQKRLQGIFKTSSRLFEDVSKTSSRRFQNVFKTSLRRLQDV